jgi:hypothetical protein
MRGYKLVSLVVLALALTAIAASSASALPSFLPGSGTFTGTSGTASLQVKGGATITCKKSTAAGSLSSETVGTTTVTFKECTALGAAAQTLGGTASTIETTTATKLCYISAAKKTVGIVFEISATNKPHIEIPALKLLLVVEGSFVGEITGTNSDKTGPYPLVIEQTGGVQKITNCEGGAVLTLKTSVDGATAVESGEEAKTGSLTFAVLHELMA